MTSRRLKTSPANPGAGASEDVPPEDVQRLLHELDVTQIELEMQNEALRTSQAELEASRARYAELYDFAPVGYLTLNRTGFIQEINLMACTILGHERRSLKSRHRRRQFPR